MGTQRPPKLKVWSLSLGCPKNRVDSERLLGSLGIGVEHVEHMGRARLVFINTCGFIEPAVRESVQRVLDAVERIGRCKKRPLLAVGGCLVGRYGARTLAEELPEVDLWLPTDALARWPQMLARALGLPPPDPGGACCPPARPMHGSRWAKAVATSVPFAPFLPSVASLPRCLRSTWWPRPEPCWIRACASWLWWPRI